MPPWKVSSRVGVVFTLLCISGCGQGKSPENFPSSESAAASALLINTWKPGTGFLLDRDERLFVTVNRLLKQGGEVKVAFSVVEDGMILGLRSEWLIKAQANQTTKGQVLIADPDRDLADRSAGVGAGRSAGGQVGQGKPGKGSGRSFSRCHGPRGDLAWAPASSSVATMAPRKWNSRKTRRSRIK